MKERLKKMAIEKPLALVLFIILFFVPIVSNLYNTQILGKFISYMIFALALDILWGYAGLMNLGFAVFFGLGGYILGISLACQNGLPAFMSSGGLKKLPWFYEPLSSPLVASILGIIIPGLIAFLLGYFIFNSKIKGVFFNIITLAFAALFELFIKNKQVYTGGSSGVNGIARGLNKITFFGEKISLQGWYYIGFVSLVLIYLLCLWLTECRFGKVIKSVRDNEARLEFLGFNPAAFKIAIFVIAGAIAGYSGMLYITMTGFISIENAGTAFSTMALVWLAVGGRGNLTGAMYGTLLVSLLQNKLSGAFGGMWQLILGVILILIVVFLKNGLIGTLSTIQYNYRINKNKGTKNLEGKVKNVKKEKVGV